SPIFPKNIFVHIDEFRKHNSDSRTISFKSIIVIYIMIGKHEMQSIPNIIMTVIVPDDTAVRKLKINPIPHPLHLISIYQHIVAVPEMNPVSGSGFRFSTASDIVEPDRTSIGFLKINPKIYIF